MNKKIGVLALMSILIISLLASAAHALATAVTFTDPTAGVTVKGTAYEFNGTITATDVQALNISVWAGSSETDGGTRLCSNISLTGDQSRWNCKVNLNSENDNESLYLNVTVGNQTDILQTSAVIYVYNDDTAPTASCSVLALQAAKGGEIYVDASGSSDNIAAASNLTYQLDLVRPDNTNATASTSSSTTFRAEDTQITGDYTVSCAVKDVAPTSSSSPSAANSARTTVTVHVSSEGKAAIAVVGAQRSIMTPVIVVMAVFVILILAIIVLAKKK